MTMKGELLCLGILTTGRAGAPVLLLMLALVLRGELKFRIGPNRRHNSFEENNFSFSLQQSPQKKLFLYFQHFIYFIYIVSQYTWEKLFWKLKGFFFYLSIKNRLLKK